MADVYGFTTTTDDGFLVRVAEEAADDTNFIIVTGKETTSNERLLVILIRNEVVEKIADVDPQAKIAGQTFGELYFDVTLKNRQVEPEYDFFALYFNGSQEEIEREIVVVRNEIRRLNNLVNDRTVRVTVESF